jgi:glycerophosphoryl diester phosphodiesterase
LDKEILLVYLSETRDEDRIARARAVGAQVLSPDFEWLTKDEVARAHAAGLRVTPWTLNEASQWKTAIEWGVDGIWAKP